MNQVHLAPQIHENTGMACPKKHRQRRTVKKHNKKQKNESVFLPIQSVPVHWRNREKQSQRIKKAKREAHGNTQRGDGAHMQSSEGWSALGDHLKPQRLARLNGIGCCVVAWIPLIPLIHLLHLKLWREDTSRAVAVSCWSTPLYTCGTRQPSWPSEPPVWPYRASNGIALIRF